MEAPFTNPIQTRAIEGRRRIEETQQHMQDILQQVLAEPSADPTVAQRNLRDFQNATKLAQATMSTYMPAITAQRERLENIQSGRTTPMEGIQAKAPPAPPWLSKFVPSQTTGEPITKDFVRTPSAQQWFAALPSERAGLAGFAEFAGGRPIEDILGHMQQMRPQKAGRSGFAPTTQRG